MITAAEMKDEIQDEIDAIDSDINATLGLLRQQEAALMFSGNDGCNDNMYNKAQGKYIASVISKISPIQDNITPTAMEELNNVISSLCKEIVGLRYRDKTSSISMEASKHTITQQRQELDTLTSSLSHTQKEHQRKLEVERKVHTQLYTHVHINLYPRSQDIHL